MGHRSFFCTAVGGSTSAYCPIFFVLLFFYGLQFKLFYFYFSGRQLLLSFSFLDHYLLPQGIISGPMARMRQERRYVGEYTLHIYT